MANVGEYGGVWPPPGVVTRPGDMRYMGNYGRDGRPISRDEGDRLFGDIDARRVGRDDVVAPDGTSYAVSTVFLVVDHCHSADPEAPPVLFETGVFRPDGDMDVVARYSTEAEAAEGHEAWVTLIERGYVPDLDP